mgnify:FL=1
MTKKILLIIILQLTFFSTSCIYLDKHYIDLENKTYSIIVKDYDYGVKLIYFQNDAQTWTSHDNFEEYFNALKGKVFLQFSVWGNDECYLSKLKLEVVDEQTNKELIEDGLYYDLLFPTVRYNSLNDFIIKPKDHNKYRIDIYYDENKFKNVENVTVRVNGAFVLNGEEEVFAFEKKLHKKTKVLTWLNKL